ncbi:cytochrome P450 [Peziza echinospora]|nr:cytochrome P450 [Peziza echinospora]
MTVPKVKVDLGGISNSEFWTSPAVLSLGIIAIASLFFLKLVGSGAKPPHGIPHHKTGIPVLGNLLAYAKDPYKYLKSAQAEHGGKFFHNLVMIRGTMLLGADMNKFLLDRKEDTLSFRNSVFLALSKIASRAYIDNTKIWLTNMKGTLRPETFRKHCEIMTEQAQKSLTDWEKTPEIEVFSAVSTLVQKIVTRCFLGEDFLEHHFDELLAIVLCLDRDAVCVPSLLLPDWVPHPAARRLWAASKRFDEIFEERWKERVRTGWKEDDHVAFTMNNPEVANIKHIVPTYLLVMMWVAHISIVPSISWTIIELLNSPTHLSQLKTHLDENFPQNSATQNSGIFYDSNNRIPPFLHATLRETLRMYPLITIRRLATSSVTLPGTSTVFPKGTMVQISPFLTHRNPDIYPNPEKWEPERFIEDGGDTLIRKLNADGKIAYLPFGGGMHKCPGEKFSMALACTIVGMLVRDYTIQWPEDVSGSVQDKETKKKERAEALKKLNFRPLGAVWCASRINISVKQR